MGFVLGEAEVTELRMEPARVRVLLMKVIARNGAAGNKTAPSPFLRTPYYQTMIALVVFSIDVPRLAAFYEAVLHVTPTYEHSGDIRLLSDQEEVLIHAIPESIAKTIEIRVPPEPREGAAIKPVFEIGSLEAALDHVRAKGGVVTGRSFNINGVIRHDVLDPDGNVIQLRGRNL
jgi:hypothetical protein